MWHEPNLTRVALCGMRPDSRFVCCVGGGSPKPSLEKVLSLSQKVVSESQPPPILHPLPTASSPRKPSPEDSPASSRTLFCQRPPLSSAAATCPLLTLPCPLLPVCVPPHRASTRMRSRPPPPPRSSTSSPPSRASTTCWCVWCRPCVPPHRLCGTSALQPKAIKDRLTD